MPAPGRKVDGIALGSIAAGSLFLYAGIKGKSISSALQLLIQGKDPRTARAANPISGNPAAGGASSTDGMAPAAPANLNANQMTARLMAGGYGWVGGEWNALYALWNRESGFNNLIANPDSGAFGISQALGHGGSGTAVIVPVVYYPGGGTAHNVTVNEYPSAAANGGSAVAQIAWGLSYIKHAYGSPSAAWAHEQANGWY